MRVRRGPSSLVPGRWSAAARRPAGFTLLEVLVAAAITVMLAGLIAGIVNNVGTTWIRASTRLGTDAQARIILDQLQVDLESAMYRDDGNVWMAADVLTGSTGGATGLWQSAQRNAKPTGSLSLDMTATRSDLIPQDQGKLEQARYGIAGVWLRFFTTRRGANSNTNTLSAPVAVAYQIIRRYNSTNSQNTNTGYLLHRVEVRPGGTTGNAPRPGVLESGYNITAAPYRSNTTNNNGSQTGDPRTIQIVTATPRGPNSLDSVIADNVIDFGIRCFVRDPNAPGQLRLVFPANTNGRLSNSPGAMRAQLPSNTPSTAPGYNYRNVFPDVIDVMIRILTDEGAAEIANMERTQTPALVPPAKYRNNAQQWWWGVAQENSRVYTRRIVINSKPL